MFTGIVEAVGRIAALQRSGGDARVRIHTGKLDLGGVRLGDSIAVNGVCLTAVAMDDTSFTAACSAETLRCTTLGAARVGDAVNLEKALTPSTPLGGHLVSGHVDGFATLTARTEVGGSLRLAFTVPAPLAKYIACKGSICVNGVSLTVNTVDGARFEVNLVPRTLQETTLGGLVVGDVVNIEADLVARYLSRLLLGDAAARPAGAGLTRELLGRYGFTHRGERRLTPRPVIYPCHSAVSPRSSTSCAAGAWWSSSSTKTARSRAISYWPPPACDRRTSTSWRASAARRR